MLFNACKVEWLMPSVAWMRTLKVCNSDLFRRWTDQARIWGLMIPRLCGVINLGKSGEFARLPGNEPAHSSIMEVQHTRGTSSRLRRGPLCQGSLFPPFLSPRSYHPEPGSSWKMAMKTTRSICLYCPPAQFIFKYQRDFYWANRLQRAKNSLSEY